MYFIIIYPSNLFILGTRLQSHIWNCVRLYVFYYYFPSTLFILGTRLQSHIWNCVRLYVFYYYLSIEFIHPGN